MTSHKRWLRLSKKELAKSACSELELGAFMGIEMKRGLTATGLRQAEVEFYLWAGCSMFPFVQIITDMQTGGAAFYSIGSSPAGTQYHLQSHNVTSFCRIGSLPCFASEAVSRRVSTFLFYNCARNSMPLKQQNKMWCARLGASAVAVFIAEQSIHWLISSVTSPS